MRCTGDHIITEW